MSLRDDEDLFADADSGDSLFDGDDDSLFGGDYGSLFDGADHVREDQTTGSCSSNAELAGPPPFDCLSLPSVPDSHGALSCSHVGHTSGQHTVSTQDPSGNVWGLAMPEPTGFEAVIDTQVVKDQAIDTFPVASHEHGDQAGHQEHTVRTPPGPSPSKDGMMQDLEMLMEAEFAQDTGGFGHINLTPAPLPAVQPARQPGDDAQVLMEYNILQDQAARASTTALGDQPANIGIPLAATEHLLANAQTRRGIRLPRRIDFDGADVNVVKPYLCFNRRDALSLHYDRLELREKTGKLLLRELKMHVMSSPEVQHLKQRGKLLSTDERRTMFLNASLHLLRSEGWGEKWFGPSSSASGTRKLVWPFDSTMIVMRFAGFLYKVTDQVRYRMPRQEDRTQSIGFGHHIGGHSQTSPIDLTNEFDGVRRDTSPNTSGSLSRPASSHLSVSHASTGGLTFADRDSASTSRRTSLALPIYRSPAFGVPASAPPPEFYIQTDPVAGLAPSGGQDTNNREENIASSRGVTLATLAQEVAGLKEKKQRPTEILPVRYRLTFKDANDEQDLRPPIFGVLADEIVKKGKVVESIQSAFSRAGVPATIIIEGDAGPIRVQSQDEWNEAVRAIWEQHGVGAVVQVHVRV